MPDKDPPFLTFFNGVCPIPSMVHFNRYSLRQANKISVENKQLSLTQGYKVTHTSLWVM